MRHKHIKYQTTNTKNGTKEEEPITVWKLTPVFVTLLDCTIVVNTCCFAILFEELLENELAPVIGRVLVYLGKIVHGEVKVFPDSEWNMARVWI